MAKAHGAVPLRLPLILKNASVCANIDSGMEEPAMANHTEELRKQYMQSPPEGMTSEDVRTMSDDDLLDMDYFLHEDDGLDEDGEGEEGFYIF